MLYALFAAAAALLLALDQWVKAWIAASFAAPLAANIYITPDPPRAWIPGVVQLTRVHNYGAAWSTFSGQRWLLVGVTSAIVLAVALLLIRRIVRGPLGVGAGFLILAGGLGNILDRIRLGYVIDMFHLQFWPSYPVFNVADICVVCGAALGAVYYIRSCGRDVKRGGSHGKTDASDI